MLMLYAIFRFYNCRETWIEKLRVFFPFLRDLHFSSCVCACVCVSHVRVCLCVYIHMSTDTQEGQQSTLGLLEMESQVVVSCLKRVLGTELRYLARTVFAVLLSAEPSLQSLVHFPVF